MKARAIIPFLIGVGPLAAPVPTGFTETLLASGLDRPVALAWLPDGRLLIAEQYTGNIRVYQNGAVQTSSPRAEQRSAISAPRRVD